MMSHAAESFCRFAGLGGKLGSKIFGGNMEEKNLKRAQGKSPEPLVFLGAEDGIWTRDPNLGKGNKHRSSTLAISRFIAVTPCNAST
jgi:hypothetical protein